MFMWFFIFFQNFEAWNNLATAYIRANDKYVFFPKNSVFLKFFSKPTDFRDFRTIDLIFVDNGIVLLSFEFCHWLRFGTINLMQNIVVFITKNFCEFAEYCKLVLF